MSVIDQLVWFTAIFVIWFSHFLYNRLIKTLVFEGQEGRHFTSRISSWDLLVLHDQPSLVFKWCFLTVSHVRSKMYKSWNIMSRTEQNRSGFMHFATVIHVYVYGVEKLFWQQCLLTLGQGHAATKDLTLHLWYSNNSVPNYCQSVSPNFGGGPGTFLKLFFNFMFMIWDSRQQDWQLFWLSFEHW